MTIDKITEEINYLSEMISVLRWDNGERVHYSSIFKVDMGNGKTEDFSTRKTVEITARYQSESNWDGISERYSSVFFVLSPIVIKHLKRQKRMLKIKRFFMIISKLF